MDREYSFNDKIYDLKQKYNNIKEVNHLTNLLFNVYDFLSLNIFDLFRDIMNCNVDQSFLYERDYRIRTINQEILPLFHPLFNYNNFITSVNLHGYFKINTISQWEIEREFKRYKRKDK